MEELCGVRRKAFIGRNEWVKEIVAKEKIVPGKVTFLRGKGRDLRQSLAGAHREIPDSLV